MSEKQTVDAAIIGLGRWGQNLVTAAASDPQCRLKFTRAVTRTPEKAQAFCDQNNLPLDTSYDAVLRDPDISAVVLATPHSQHTDQITAAVTAGKHVFVEKPPALSLGEAMRAVAAGRVLAVGFNRRFLPAFMALKALLEDGSLGSPLHIEANFLGPFGYNFSADMWRGTVSVEWHQWVFICWTRWCIFWGRCAVPRRRAIAARCRLRLMIPPALCSSLQTVLTLV